jgi:hypothetical protein
MVITPPGNPSDNRRRQLVNHLFQQYKQTSNAGRAAAAGGGTAYRQGSAPGLLHTAMTQLPNVAQGVLGKLGPGGIGLSTAAEHSPFAGGEVHPPQAAGMPMPQAVPLPLPGPGAGGGGLVAANTPANPYTQTGTPGAPANIPGVSNASFATPTQAAAQGTTPGSVLVDPGSTLFNSVTASLPSTAVSLGGGSYFDPVSGQFITPGMGAATLGGSASRLQGSAGATNTGV